MNVRAGRSLIAGVMVTNLKIAAEKVGTDSGFLTLHDAPRVESPSHSLTSGFHHSVAADHCKRSALLHHKTSAEEVKDSDPVLKLYSIKQLYIKVVLPGFYFS